MGKKLGPDSAETRRRVEEWAKAELLAAEVWWQDEGGSATVIGIIRHTTKDGRGTETRVTRDAEGVVWIDGTSDQEQKPAALDVTAGEVVVARNKL